jgi:CRP/FNR family cyclic AMP-dependent transcriptional regulator
MQTISRMRPKPSAYKRRGNLLNGGLLPQGVESIELGFFFDNAEKQHYPAGTTLFSPEDSGERLYILRQGLVDLFRVTSSGKRLVTRQILPGSIFGIMGLLGQSTQGNFAEAAEDSTICVVTQDDVLETLKQHPDVTLNLLEIVGKRLRLIEERLVETAYSPVRVRLAHFLLTNADSASGTLSNLTHEEIGDAIGAVRQTVTETLGLLRKQGLVQTKLKQIRIINRHGLEEIVKSR